MRRKLLSAAVALALYACGGDGNGSTGPSGVNITGTFIGDYTVAIEPGVVYQGVLQLTQSGNSVSGTLTTNAGRSAAVSGSFVSETRLTTTFNFTDGCAGSASAIADITNNATRLTGNYNANDCLGFYSGGFALDKQ